ncbi:MAG: AAA family ATPase [Planctomycetota bacterium]
MSQDPNAQAALEFASAEEEARRRREMVIALFRGRLHWAVILALVLGSAAAVAGYFSQKPVFQGAGIVQVQPEVESILENDSTGLPPMFRAYLEGQISMIGSQQVAERAMQSDTWKEAIRTAGADSMSAARFASTIEADMVSTTDYNIAVTFTHESPAVATAAVNAALESYRTVYQQGEAAGTDQQLSKIKAELRTLRQEERMLMSQINNRLEIEQDLFRPRLQKLNEELIEVERELRATQTRLAFMAPDAAKAAGLEEFQDPNVLAMEEQMANLEMDIQMKKSLGKGERHRDVQELRAMINVLQARKQRYIEQLKAGDTPSGAGTEVAQMRRAEQELRQQQGELQAKIAEADALLVSIAPYNLQLESVAEKIELLSYKEYETRIAGEATKDRVRVAQWAVEPSKPSNASSRLQLGVLGFIGGGGMGLALVVMVGLLDSRLRHAADAKNGLRDVRMLGVLPSLPDNLADPEQAERAAHAVNHIRTLLQISGSNTRVFSITGPAAGSGKSSLSVALGLSFAATGNKVLLIDSDIVGAGLTRRLGAVVNKPFDEVVRDDGRVSAMQIEEAEQLAMSKGINLMDALIELGALNREEAEKLARRRSDAALGVLDACEGTPIEECVAETGIPRLHVLPVGSARPEDAGLLSPKMLQTMFNAAREAYDIVLVDTGPVLGSLEASMAGAEADGTVLIVSRGDSKGVATKSLEHLQSVGARVTGVVFNHALETDLGETSYGSMVSQDRRGGSIQVDPAAAARFGPLGSAVATYAPSSALREKASATNGRSLATAGRNGDH